jgi:serine/threonine protein phosphatase 1
MKRNPYTCQVPQCIGKRYVIPDIHGCLKTFTTLIDKIGLTKSDQLFLLGDYVDRGPSSVDVVDLIIHLQNDGYPVYPLIGNHEEELILFQEFGSIGYIEAHVEKNKLQAFFDEDFMLKEKYQKFFASLSYYIELDDFILVHAGFNFDKAKPFEDIESMTFIRNWQYKPEPARGKTIVHGHSPLEFEDIHNKIEKKFKVIPLDNGCVFPRFKDMGNLLCLGLDDFELFVQANIDQ